MSTKFDIYTESGKKALEHLKNYTAIAKQVKTLTLETWPTAEVYVFGSAVKGEYTAASDIDILITLPEKPSLDEEAKVKAKIYKNLDAPIQLHVATKEQLTTWYKKFIDKMEKIE